MSRQLHFAALPAQPSQPEQDDEVDDPTQALLGGSFADWRDTCSSMDLTGLDDAGFLGMLRPYYWYVHQPGFQDVFDACIAAAVVLRAHADDLDDGYNYPGLSAFLAGYIDDEALNSSGWVFLGANAEMAASVSAGALAEVLQELSASAAEVSALKSVELLMKRITGAKHMAGNNVREIGSKHVDTIDAIIDTLHPDDQDFILHAMDGFKGDPAVIAMYEGFLERNPNTPLAERVAEYLGSVK